MEPKNPIDAVTHRDPYPYYARLLTGPGLQYDDELKLWIAPGASAVAEIFASPVCRVRPILEPIPALIEGSPAGEIFGSLVRMNDGTRHAQPKLALKRALASISLDEVEARARHLALESVPEAGDTGGLSTWILNTPVSVVADLLGFDADALPTLATWTREFVACLSPLSTSEQLAAASASAIHLQSRMHSLLKSTRAQRDSLVSQVIAQADAVGWADTDIIANLVGLLSQTYEATSGLIGNTIVTVAGHPHLIDEVRARPDGWAQLVHETSRYDSPVQNTRRYAAERTRIAGVDLEPGSAILLLLGAANRDPSANPHPEDFRLDRANRCVFTFGRGAHACPGEALARTIATAAVQVLFEILPNGWFRRLSWSFRPSANVRLPVFHPLTEYRASS